LDIFYGHKDFYLGFNGHTDNQAQWWQMIIV